MARTKRKTNPVIPAMEAPTQAQKQYRAAAYVRLSVEDSGKPGADTIEGQKSLLLRFIEDDPTLTLYRLFCDNGRTGTDFQRPEFEKLMEAVKRGEVDCIVVKDLSRFGRNYKETGNYLERIFPFLGVRFIAVNDGFDTLTAQRGADGYLVPLKNLINEVYSKDISKKSGSALAAKQKNGDFIGAWAPYGYRKQPDNPHKLEPDEATAPVVRQIFRWRAEGVSVTQIARRLNDEGVLRHGGAGGGGDLHDSAAARKAGSGHPRARHSRDRSGKSGLQRPVLRPFCSVYRILQAAAGQDREHGKPV